MNDKKSPIGSMYYELFPVIFALGILFALCITPVNIPTWLFWSIPASALIIGEFVKYLFERSLKD